MGPHELVARNAPRHKDSKSSPIMHVPRFRHHQNTVARVLVPQSGLLLLVPVGIAHDYSFKRENRGFEDRRRVVLMLGVFRGNVRHFPQIVPLVLPEGRAAFQDLLQRVERRLTRQRRPVVIKFDVDRPSVNPYRF